MKQLLSESARYNAWANEHLVNLFRSVDDDYITENVVSSFPSIRATLTHIWDVETLWLERLRGYSPTTFPSKNFKGSNDTLYEKLLDASNALTEFIVSRPAPYYRNKMRFRLSSANEEMYESVTDMAYQCLNHSTYHRGQLVTMCRQLKIGPIPRTDFILYRREAQSIEVY